MTPAPLVHQYVDDFPDFILEGFGDHKRALGRYPRVLWVSALLGYMMTARPGVWRPTPGFPGVWGWTEKLTAETADGMDEFGNPD